MRAGIWNAIVRPSLLIAASALAANAGAEIFYAGDTKGLPGEEVELSINARAGTVLDSLDILPDYDAVASVISLVSFNQTPAFLDADLVTCNPAANTCGMLFVEPKTFGADTLLATLRFSIAAAAPVGPVPFDAGVFVADDPLPIPVAQNFEVLAVPEPSHWALMLLGLGVVGLRARQRMTRTRRAD